jgi:hypothetical protein
MLPLFEKTARRRALPDKSLMTVPGASNICSWLEEEINFFDTAQRLVEGKPGKFFRWQEYRDENGTYLPPCRLTTVFDSSWFQRNGKQI